MISYREKQLLMTMKYLQDETINLSNNLHKAIEMTEKGDVCNFDIPEITPVECYDDLVQLATDAGYDTYIRAEDILSPEAIADLEKRREEIDEQFERLTKLRKKDIALLFLGTGLQIARWAIITTVKPLSLDYTAELTSRNQRLTHTEGDDLVKAYTNKNNKKNDELVKKQVDKLKELGEEKQAIKKFEEKIEERKELIEKYKSKDYSKGDFRTVQQILFGSVPYDAQNSTDKNRLNLLIKKKIGGTNHRSYTMGHDPVFGWIFGPINITTRSITFKTPLMSTFPVLEKGNVISFPQTNILDEFQNALKSWNENDDRKTAAFIKQTLHYVSDKYTKGGLPIPFITAEKAQELMNRDWNSVEAKKWIKKALHTFSHDTVTVALEFFLSHYINELIRILHILICHDEDDYDSRFLEVRTRKVISISNTISSGSNIIYSVVKAYVTQNPITGLQVLDIGGIVETIHRLITNSIFISKMKDEFIKSTINKDFQEKLKEIEEGAN